jgi:cobalt-zinc-cadmium efflux system protein
MDDQSHSHIHRHDQAESGLRIAFWLNAAFAVVEVAGGIMTNSMAVISDALHDAGDAAAIGIAWYFQRLSLRKRDETYSFGYKRFSVLGALINSLILLSGSCIILYESIPRIIHPQPVHNTGMLFLAILGIAVNSFAMFRVKKGETRNEEVISLHLLEDVMGWIAILIVSVVLFFFDLPVLDPLLSVTVTLFILFRLQQSLRATFRILLQGSPRPELETRLRNRIENIDGITGLHDLHIWTMDGSYYVATLHLEVDHEMNLSETEAVKEIVRKVFMESGIEHVTIEIELKGQACALDHC